MKNENDDIPHTALSVVSLSFTQHFASSKKAASSPSSSLLHTAVAIWGKDSFVFSNNYCRKNFQLTKEELMDNQKDMSKQSFQSSIRGGQRCFGIKDYSPFAFSSTCFTSCRTCIMQEGEENQPWKRSNVFSHILSTCVHQIWIFTDLVFFR